jgi:hypothetical protein
LKLSIDDFESSNLFVAVAFDVIDAVFANTAAFKDGVVIDIST